MNESESGRIRESRDEQILIAESPKNHNLFPG